MTTNQAKSNSVHFLVDMSYYANVMVTYATATGQIINILEIGRIFEIEGKLAFFFFIYNVKR